MLLLDNSEFFVQPNKLNVQIPVFFAPLSHFSTMNDFSTSEARHYREFHECIFPTKRGKPVIPIIVNLHDLRLSILDFIEGGKVDAFSGSHSPAFIGV